VLGGGGPPRLVPRACVLVYSLYLLSQTHFPVCFLCASFRSTTFPRSTRKKVNCACPIHTCTASHSHRSQTHSSRVFSLFLLPQYDIPGVNTPMLYFGMLFSMFCWHVEVIPFISLSLSIDLYPYLHRSIYVCVCVCAFVCVCVCVFVEMSR